MTIVDLTGFKLVNGQQARGCPHMKEWLPVANRYLIYRGFIRQHVDILQAYGSAELSGNTHLQGTCLDLVQTDIGIVAALREGGAPATWVRGPEARKYKASSRAIKNFGNHIHMALDCPCWSNADYQIDEVKSGYDGLAGDGKDYHAKPSKWRDYKEGIAWMEAQMAPKPAPVSLKALNKAARGGISRSHTKILQTRLKELGFYKHAIDSKFGPETRKALNAYRWSLNYSKARATATDIDFGTWSRILKNDKRWKAVA